MKTSAFHSPSQHTLKHAVQCEGIGLHRGTPVALKILPAPAHSGIRFIRTDLPQQPEFPAEAARVGDTKLGTVLTHASGETLSTIEHLMAAFWGAGIDNARVYVHGNEIPIMDGSSEPFLRLFAQAGLKNQHLPRRVFEVETPLHLSQDDSEIEILPYDGFAVEVNIDFPHHAIGKQHIVVDFSEQSFADALSNARTFGFLKEVEYLKTIGLARGGSLENAIVIDDKGILNPEGLRDAQEFVQHKALDMVGDLFLCGGRIRGYVKASRPGHTLNTAMARLLAERFAAAPARRTAHGTHAAPQPVLASFPAFA